MRRAGCIALVCAFATTTAHAQPLRLPFVEAVRRAMLRNPNAMVALEEIRRAGAVLEEVRAASLPTLVATALTTQLDSARHSTVNPTVIITPQTRFLPAGSATLPLYPQNWVRWAQAREAVTVSRLSAAEVRRNVAIAVGQVYLAQVTQHRIVDAAELAVHNATAHVEYAKARLDAGNGTLLDYERATALLASYRTQLENARFVVVRLAEQLGILLGETQPIDVMPTLALPPPPPDAAVALADALRLRADLRLSRELVTQTTRIVRDSWADYVPWASLNFQPFWQTPPDQAFPHAGYQLLFDVGFEIYDGGLRYGLLKERRALAGEAHIRLDAQLRLVSADVRTATAELAHATAALTSARESARLWTDALRLTFVAYRAGLSTNIEVIDAQTAALNADVQAALAENNEQQAELDLLLASGRFP
jgi:outer membrane protein TolC